LEFLPRLFTTAQRQQFIQRRIDTRTDGTEDDPDNGTLPADFVCDRIHEDESIVYKNAGYSNYPFMDGIAFVVDALHADWIITGDDTLFTTNETDINTCLAALPKSSNAIYSDPANASVDYGFTDTILKTGRVTYGTALLGKVYKQMAAMNGESGSGTYTTLLNTTKTALEPLRRANNFYMGSETNNSGVDDVWATALIVAEDLVSGPDRVDSAQAIADNYQVITDRGWIRHLPAGQYWAGTATVQDTYQNGGYWITPLWDCIRSVALVDRRLALRWAQEAADEFRSQVDDEGVEGEDTAPYEWFYSTTNSNPKGYCESLAKLAPLCDASVSRTLTHDTTPTIDDDFATDTSANYTDSGMTWGSGVVQADNSADGEYFVNDTSLNANQGAALDIRADYGGGAATDNAPALILRWQDSSNYIFIHVREDNTTMYIYEVIADALNNRGTVTLGGDMPGDAAYTTLRAWAIGTTVTAHFMGKKVTGTVTTITGSGKVGGRHGKGGVGTGDTYYDNLKGWNLTSGTIPADVALVSDDEVLAPGDESAVIVANPMLIDAEGTEIDSGSSSLGAITIA
jgi:hypothetical protein